VVALSGAYAIAGRLNNNSLGWVLLLNLDGSIAWQKSYAAAGTTLMAMDAAPGVGMIFAATTTTLGRPAGHLGRAPEQRRSIVWQKRYGGPGNDYANRVRATSDGGFIVLGAPRRSPAPCRTCGSSS